MLIVSSSEDDIIYGGWFSGFRSNAIYKDF